MFGVYVRKHAGIQCGANQMTTATLDKLQVIQEQNKKRLGFKTSVYHKAVMKLYEENEEVVLAQFRRIV